jgi:hypothetical protein
MATGPFVKVYQSIVDDPMFERVWHNDRALATWLRMLLLAHAMYPASAPMVVRNPTVRLLIDCGLVIEKPRNRYTIYGLEKARERTSDAARNAAAVRWQSGRNADAMPSRIEKSRIENGAQRPHTPGTGSIGGAHTGQHPDCLVCAPLRAAQK